MQTSPLRRHVTRSVLRVAVAAVVLGIVAMHALSLHGFPTPGGTGSVASVAMTPVAGSMHTAHPDGDLAVMGNATTRELPAMDGIEAGNHQTSPGHDMSDMVMLCVDMLAAAASAFLLAYVLRLVPRIGWLTARLGLRSVLTGLTRAVIGTGPPVVWQFSVIRC